MGADTTVKPGFSMLRRALVLAAIVACVGWSAVPGHAEQSPSSTPAPVPLPPKRNIAGPGDYGIREKIVHLISIDAELRVAKIDVVLVNGGAIFSGEIKNCALKRRLLTIGGLMRGVVNVTDEMTIPRGNTPDEEVAKTVARVLGDHAESLELKGLDVRVNDGVLTLEGTVKDMPARNSAEDLIGSVEGITRIANHLKPADAPSGVDDESLEKAVIAYLGDYKAYPYRSDLTVKVAQGKVTLKGKAALYVSRQLAGLVASLVPGVTGVVNQVKIDPSIAIPQNRVRAED